MGFEACKLISTRVVSQDADGAPESDPPIELDVDLDGEEDHEMLMDAIVRLNLSSGHPV